MSTLNWSISNLDRELSDGYVYNAHWNVSLIDGEHSASSYGSVGLERPETSLIPYEDLTEELVISWVQEKLGEESVQRILSSLQTQIDEQKTPKHSSGKPW